MSNNNLTEKESSNRNNVPIQDGKATGDKCGKSNVIPTHKSNEEIAKKSSKATQIDFIQLSSVCRELDRLLWLICRDRRK